jgi:hypothetical protein
LKCFFRCCCSMFHLKISSSFYDNFPPMSAFCAFLLFWNEKFCYYKRQ